VWKSFMSSGDIDNHAVIYFESSYFHPPKELYLEGSWFRALDKSKMEIVIDTERGQVIRAPSDALSVKSVTMSGGYKKLALNLHVDSKVDDMMGYSPLSYDFKDASGKAYHLADVGSGVMTWSADSNKPNDQQSYVFLDDKKYVQPLTFQVTQYPSYIHGSYKIRVK
jgi:hypothetical protein